MISNAHDFSGLLTPNALSLIEREPQIKLLKYNEGVLLYRLKNPGAVSMQAEVVSYVYHNRDISWEEAVRKAVTRNFSPVGITEDICEVSVLYYLAHAINSGYKEVSIYRESHNLFCFTVAQKLLFMKNDKTILASVNIPLPHSFYGGAPNRIAPLSSGILIFKYKDEHNRDEYRPYREEEGKRNKYFVAFIDREENIYDNFFFINDKSCMEEICQYLQLSRPKLQRRASSSLQVEALSETLFETKLVETPARTLLQTKFKELKDGISNLRENRIKIEERLKQEKSGLDEIRQYLLTTCPELNERAPSACGITAAPSLSTRIEIDLGGLKYDIETLERLRATRVKMEEGARQVSRAKTCSLEDEAIHAKDCGSQKSFKQF